MAESGFFPGVIYYLSLWFPATYRARAISGIIIGIPLSQVLGAPLGGAQRVLGGRRDCAGQLDWHNWRFLWTRHHRISEANNWQRFRCVLGARGPYASWRFGLYWTAPGGGF
jgi:MFS family permease